MKKQVRTKYDVLNLHYGGQNNKHICIPCIVDNDAIRITISSSLQEQRKLPQQQSNAF